MRNLRQVTLAVWLAAVLARQGRPAETAKPGADLSPYERVSSIVWVARDIDPILHYYENLGLKNIQRTGVREFRGLTYRARPAPTTAKLAFGHVGNVLLEWIQPVAGTNLYTDFLERHGDGVLALGYAVDSDEELERQIEYFHSKGVEALQLTQWEGTQGAGHGAYFDTAAKGGGISIAVYYDPDHARGGNVQSPRNEAPFNQITHFAFVVRNVRQVGDYWQSLGFGALTMDHNVSVDRVYRGKPGQFEMDLGWTGGRDARFEWIQSTQGPNLYEEYLKRHGEGLHHLGFDEADFDARIKLLAARGAPTCMSGGWDTPRSKGRFAYLDTDPHGGVTIELLWDQPRGK